MYRLDPDRSVHVTGEGLSIPNGLVFGLDGTWAFHIDTPSGRVDRVRIGGDGTFGDRTPFLTVHGGGPDGMAADVDGGLWVAIWGGGAVHHYSAAGVLEEVVEVPARQVTSCAFGGPDRTTLFITTSRHGLGRDAEPEAGAVFSVEAGIDGAGLGRFPG